VDLQSNDLIRHNLVVFSNGDGALKVLPNLVDTIPEARLNLVSATSQHLRDCGSAPVGVLSAQSRHECYLPPSPPLS
jgi:hypothetical protein